MSVQGLFSLVGGAAVIVLLALALALIGVRLREEIVRHGEKREKEGRIEGRRVEGQRRDDR